MAKKIFETKKINMETLPEYLKAARESFSYDLKQVSKITNISEKFLGYLEEGFYHRLPADVYIYGFLKKLGELYRVDAELLIQQYKKERGIHDKINRTQPARQITRPVLPQKIAITPKNIAYAAGVLLVLFVIGYISYQVHAINRPPMIKISEPADGSVIHASSVVLEGQTDIGANLSIDGQDIQVDSQGNFKEPISVTAGAKVLTFVASNSFGKKSSRQISIIGDLSNQPQTAAQNQKFNITVSVGPNPTVLSVSVDDSQPVIEQMANGAVKTYSANQKITLSTADAGSTYVQINSGQKFKLGKNGQNLNDLVFTPGSVSDSSGGLPVAPVSTTKN